MTRADAPRRSRAVPRAASSATPTPTVDAWAFDSRALETGSCFVALRGDRDGHDFVAAAFAAGATRRARRPRRSPVALGPAGTRSSTSATRSSRCRSRAQSLRADRPELHVVAVGGLDRQDLDQGSARRRARARWACHANAESYNNEFGLPITLCNTPAAARVVVTEMGERFAGDLDAAVRHRPARRRGRHERRSRARRAPRRAAKARSRCCRSCSTRCRRAGSRS